MVETLRDGVGLVRNKANNKSGHSNSFYSWEYFPFCSYLGSTSYPDFINPEMRDLWVGMFAYDQYEVGLLPLI